MPTEDLAAREAYLKAYRGAPSADAPALDSEDVQERMRYLTRKRKLESVSGFKSYKMPDWKEIGAMGDDPSAINIGKQKRLFDEAEVGDEIYDPYSGYTAVKVSNTEYSVPEYDQERDKAKPVEAFVHAAAREMPAVAGGVAAMGAVQPGATALAKSGHPILAGGLTLGAGLAGTLATGMGVDALLPEEARKMLEKERKDQPVASTAGGLAASVPFFGVGKGADTVRKEIMNRAAPAAIGTGLGVANEVASAGTIDPSEFEEGAAGRIAMMGGQNALFNTNTKLGDQIMKLGGKATTSIVALADKAASAPTASQSNSEANQIALGQPIDNYKPGRPEELGGLEGFTPKEGMDFGPQAEIKGLGLEKTTPTKKPTTIQSQIESELGIGRPNHTDVLTAAQAADEAERIVAKIALDAAGDTGVRPGEPGKFGSGDEAKGDFFPVPAVKTDTPALAAKDTTLAKILETDVSGAPRSVIEGPTRGPVLEDVIGQRARYEGYEGTIIKDKEGTYAILRDVVKPGEPKVVEIAGAGKNPSQLAAELGVELPPALPKPASRQSLGAMAAQSIPSIGEPLAGAAIGDLAARATGQDDETIKKWRERGFQIGAGLSIGGSMARNGTIRLTKAGLQDMGAAAWHGSPHKFDRFSTKKIGAGEGNQTYGHGLYFAENPKVAESYKESMGKSHLMLNGKEMLATYPPHNDMDAAKLFVINNWAGDWDKTIEWAKKTGMYHWKQGLTPESAIKEIERLRDVGARVVKSGNMYKVDLKAKDEDFLLWDKPISEHPPAAQKKLLAVLQDLYPEQKISLENNGFITGQDLYHSLVNADLDGSFGRSGPEKASNYLNEFGELKGIKYADQGSRNLGDMEVISGRELKARQIKENGSSGFPTHALDRSYVVFKGTAETSGEKLSEHYDSAVYGYKNKADAEAFVDKNKKTHNYVIFNDKDIKILDVNGKPIDSTPEISSERGAMNTALMFQLAKGSATVSAALIGYQKGDTPEEKRRNAMLAAMVVAGGAYGRSALNLLRKSAPAVAKQVVETHGEPLTAKENEPPILETESPAWKPFFSKIPVVGPALKQATIAFDNIYAIAPKIAGKMRDMVWRELAIGADLHNAAMPSLRKLREVLSPQGFDRVGRLLMSGKEQEAFDLLENTPGTEGALYELKLGWPTVREEAYQAWKRARPDEDFGQLEGYWPRVVADSKKLKEILGQDDSDIVTDLLAKALGAKRKKTGNYEATLTKEEEGQALSTLLAGNMQFPGKPSHLKPRTLKEIDDNWNDIFEPVDVALDKYIGRISRDIAVNEFLGRVNNNAKDPWTDLNTTEENPVGALVAEGVKDKSISLEGREQIVKNINAYLNQPKGEGWQFALQQGIGTFRTATNLTQIYTAATQLQDVFLTAAINSPTTGLKGFGRAVAGRLPGSNVRSWKVADVNISEMNPEIADYARGRNVGEKIVHFALKPFFKVADRLGRETFLNSTAFWATEQARLANPSAKFKGAAKAYEAMFGKEEWADTLKMMKEADWMDPRLKKFLFNHISGYQPTSRLEMPVGMLEAGPLGKIPWGLMTFTLRQSGAIRRQAYEELKAGNIKEAALFMSAYALWVGVGNSMVQYAKDAASGKPAEPSDYPFGVILQMLALNKITVGQLAEGNMAEAVGERMFPGVYRPIKAVGQDIGTARDIAMGRERFFGKGVMETPKYVPWFGKMYYDRFGRGAEVQRKNQRSRKPQPTTLDKLSDMVIGKERKSR